MNGSGRGLFEGILGEYKNLYRKHLCQHFTSSWPRVQKSEQHSTATVALPAFVSEHFEASILVSVFFYRTHWIGGLSGPQGGEEKQSFQ